MSKTQTLAGPGHRLGGLLMVSVGYDGALHRPAHRPGTCRPTPRRTVDHHAYPLVMAGCCRRGHAWRPHRPQAEFLTGLALFAAASLLAAFAPSPPVLIPPGLPGGRAAAMLPPPCH